MCLSGDLRTRQLYGAQLLLQILGTSITFKPSLDVTDTSLRDVGRSVVANLAHHSLHRPGDLVLCVFRTVQWKVVSWCRCRRRRWQPSLSGRGILFVSDVLSYGRLRG